MTAAGEDHPFSISRYEVGARLVTHDLGLDCYFYIDDLEIWACRTNVEATQKNLDQRAMHCFKEDDDQLSSAILGSDPAHGPSASSSSPVKPPQMRARLNAQDSVVT